ncbi:MAG: molybdenum ABC transporter ATP-binding protein [Alsobacter sp.]
MSRGGGLEASFRDRLGGFTLQADFTAPASGVTALFGPSGCGKTTVLRCIAGLHRAPEGRLALGGAAWQVGDRFLPAHQRPVGYVFQEASLFPHLDVRRNLLFGYRRAVRHDASAPVLGIDEVVGLLGIERLLGRAPHHLSGGERQRVAIGRALLSQPAILLMDEPLSALDRQSKDEILPFLERLHEALAIPAIYVSHDLGEVERLTDHLVLMEAGRVVAQGPLLALQSDPALPLARGRGAAVSLQAAVAGHDPAYGLLSLDVPGGRLTVPGEAARTGEVRRLRILAGDVSLALTAPGPTSIANILPGRVLSMTDTGPAERTIVLGLGEDGGGARILARITRRSADQLGLAVGLAVYAQIKGVALLPSRTRRD